MGLSAAMRHLAVALATMAITTAGSSAAADTSLRADPHGPSANPSLGLVVQLQDAFAGVADRVFPSVVGVAGYVRDESTHTKPETAETPSAKWRGAKDAGRYPGFTKLHSGSGVIIGEEGHTISLRQFVTTPDGKLVDLVEIETHDGRYALVRIVGVEPTLNLAVLEFLTTPKRNRLEFAPATIGNSDSVRVGHWTIALGDPSGPERAFSPGVLAGAAQRRCYQDELSATYMHASLKIHPEAYGGPLVNIQGEVVGITTPRPLRVSAFDGLEYALPMNIVMPVYQGICATKSVRSPWFGISVLEIGALRDRFKDPGEFRSMATPMFGVYIDDVFDPSPASRTGIRVGDFLISIDRQRLHSVYQFQELLYLMGIGHTATLEIFRDGETLFMDATIEERPESAKPR